MGMYIKNEQFEALANMVEWSKRTDRFKFVDLTKAEQDILVNAEVALIKAYRRQKKDNARTNEYIKEKRKTNKNYGR